MRLNLILPKVEPNVFAYPKKCPRKGCSGMRFIPRQEVSKKIVDAQYPQVTAWRCECRKCGRVLRAYPKGVSRKQISKRVNGMPVMLYIWWIKERYRSMRGYKQERSALGIGRLIAFAGNNWRMACVWLIG